jgi:hypothetical protein
MVGGNTKRVIRGREKDTEVYEGSRGDHHHFGIPVSIGVLRQSGSGVGADIRVKQVRSTKQSLESYKTIVT